MAIMGWLVLGFLIGSLIEWLAHRYLLHNFKLKRLSYSHFSIHHKNCRKNQGFDSDYVSPIPADYEHGWSEILFLLAGVFLTSPLVLLSFWLWFALLIHSILYYVLHRYFHLNPSWGKKYMPWHWDHHMGKNQNSNWGVTNPIFDWIFRTRIHEHGKFNDR